MRLFRVADAGAKIFSGFPRDKSISAVAGSSLFSAELIVALAATRDAARDRKRERERERERVADKDAPLYENTLNATRSSLFPAYPLCNTKCTPGTGNLHPRRGETRMHRSSRRGSSSIPAEPREYSRSWTSGSFRPARGNLVEYSRRRVSRDAAPHFFSNSNDRVPNDGRASFDSPERAISIDDVDISISAERK